MIDYLNYGKQVQSIPKEPQSKIKICIPQSSHGWLEYKLNQTELNYLWSCVNHKENEYTQYLVGNIDSSFLLEDKNNWFFNNTITPLINHYENTFGYQAQKVPIFTDKDEVEFHMLNWWVNYQKQYEFNPLHKHDGVYSFVIWLKIPYEWEEQNKDNKSRAKDKGTFSFQYTNMFGELLNTDYKLGKKHEGTMLLFPSRLNHEVHPFYNCEEERISISGNILLKI